MRTSGCRCCGSKVNQEQTTVRGVFECHCGAIYGECYKGDSFRFYSPRFAPAEVGNQNDTFYLDLTTVGSDGIERFHGWIDKVTNLVVQVG